MVSRININDMVKNFEDRHKDSKFPLRSLSPNSIVNEPGFLGIWILLPWQVRWTNHKLDPPDHQAPWKIGPSRDFIYNRDSKNPWLVYIV